MTDEDDLPESFFVSHYLARDSETKEMGMREHTKRDSIRFYMHESTYNHKFSYDASAVEYQSTKRQFQRPGQSHQIQLLDHATQIAISQLHVVLQAFVSLFE
jgi:hypothetical protein